MSEKVENTGAVKPEQEKQPEGERENLVMFSKPYKFEGKEYTELDLSGLEKLTIRDAIDAQRALFGQQEVASSLLCETTTAFSMEIASKATGKPIEFFKLMPIGSGRMVKRKVQEYINARNGAEGSIMKLEKPYFFGGEQYTEFDLSGIAEMSIMQESAAENAMAREGFVITENSFNYLYACVMAAMATGKTKETFTGLPLRELLKLKEAVNNTDFFE